MSIKKIAVILFCVGVFISGLGFGIAFIEYSSFEFMGVKNLTGEKMETKTIVRKLSKDEKKLGNVQVEIYDDDVDMQVKTSKAIPKDEIRFAVAYHSESVADIHVDEDATEEGTSNQKTEIFWISPVVLEETAFDLLLKNKEEVLSNIKHKKFYRYEFSSIQSVQILVNPQNKKKIEVM